MKFNEEINNKIIKAIEYLKSIGGKEIFIFGSLADGTFNASSDLDLAVTGISPRNYFKAEVVLPTILNQKVDLVALDYVSKDFAKKIRMRGEKLFAA